MKTSSKLISIVSGLLILALHADAGLIDTPVSITPIANSSYIGILPGFSSGTTTLGGVTFDLPLTRPDWQSNIGSAPPDLSASLSLSINDVSSVHFLLNTGNTYSSQMSIGDRIGTITLSFASAPSLSIPLEVGVNIREQAIGLIVQPIIGTFTSPTLQQVWSGNNNGGILSTVDMLTIPVSGLPTLTGITIQDESTSRIGQANPVLALKGITVQSVPEPGAMGLFAILMTGVFLATRRRGARSHLHAVA